MRRLERKDEGEHDNGNVAKIAGSERHESPVLRRRRRGSAAVWEYYLDDNRKREAWWRINQS